MAVIRPKRPRRRPKRMPRRAIDRRKFFENLGWKISRAGTNKVRRGLVAKKRDATVRASCIKSLCNRMAAKEVGFK